MRPDRKNLAKIYARVSTGEQFAENQIPTCQKLAGARDLSVVEVVEESISAAKKRPAFERLKEEARRGEFGVLIVWKLDRFGRSMIGNVADVLSLEAFGVRVISVTEPWCDSTDTPTRNLLLAIFGWIAERERITRGERTRAGMARAARQGKRAGRRPAQIDLDRVRALRAEGLEWTDVAQRLGVGRSTLHRYMSTSRSPGDEARADAPIVDERAAHENAEREAPIVDESAAPPSSPASGVVETAPDPLEGLPSRPVGWTRGARPFNGTPPTPGQMLAAIAAEPRTWAELCQGWPTVRPAWITQILTTLRGAGLAKTSKEDRRWHVTDEGIDALGMKREASATVAIEEIAAPVEPAEEIAAPVELTPKEPAPVERDAPTLESIPALVAAPPAAPVRKGSSKCCACKAKPPAAGAALCAGCETFVERARQIVRRAVLPPHLGDMLPELDDRKLLPNLATGARYRVIHLALVDGVRRGLLAIENLAHTEEQHDARPSPKVRETAPRVLLEPKRKKTPRPKKRPQKKTGRRTGSRRAA